MPKKSTVRRRREIRRGLAHITPADAHPQSQSWLFRFPPEIRNEIFELACSQYEEAIEVQPSRFPGYRTVDELRRCLKVSTALLSTCKMAYSETCLVPIRSATIVVDLFQGGDTLTAIRKLFSDLRRPIFENLNHVHLFTEHYELCYSPRIFRLPQFCPTWLTVTLEERLGNWGSITDLLMGQRFPVSVRKVEFWMPVQYASTLFTFGTVEGISMARIQTLDSRTLLLRSLEVVLLNTSPWEGNRNAMRDLPTSLSGAPYTGTLQVIWEDSSSVDRDTEMDVKMCFRDFSGKETAIPLSDGSEVWPHCFGSAWDVGAIKDGYNEMKERSDIAMVMARARR